MHRDTKVGLALGVLLVGVVAAFFFRHDDSPNADVPRLADPAAIDASISDRDVTPYLTEAGAEIAASDDDGADQQWRLPDFLQDDTSMSIAGEPLPDLFGTLEVTPSTSDVPVDTPRRSDGSGGRTYVVQSGDTLTGIASRLLGSSSRFEELYEANRDVLESPDRLRLGQRLRIPDGTRRIERVAAEPRRDEADVSPVSSRHETAEPRTEPAPVAVPEARATTETIRVDELDRENAGRSARRRFVPVRRSPYTGTP